MIIIDHLFNLSRKLNLSKEISLPLVWFVRKSSSPPLLFHLCPLRARSNFMWDPDLKFSEFINENSPEAGIHPFRLEIGWFSEKFYIQDITACWIIFQVLRTASMVGVVEVVAHHAACGGGGGGGNCFRSWALSSRFNPNSVPPTNTPFHPSQCHWPVQDDRANFLPDFNKFGSLTSPQANRFYCYFVPTKLG